jgi:hypothetical protein
MNDLSGFSYVDRLNDPSSKLPSLEIDTCSVLQLVAKGFAQEAKYSKDPSTFGLARFISFVQYSTNYKDLTKEKGFEIVEQLRDAKYQYSVLLLLRYIQWSRVSIDSVNKQGA